MDEARKPTLLDLFVCNKKKDLKKLAQKAYVTADEFAGVILAAEAGTIPWLHRISHREFRPSHLELTDADLQALRDHSKGGDSKAAQKTMSKIGATFDERRLLVGHIFYLPDQSGWHFIYFDQRDYSSRANHWSGGSHFHLINHLWPRLTAQTVWTEFHQGNPVMRRSLHVAWERSSSWGS